MMHRPLNHLWRIFAKCFCFTVFGLGGLVLWLMVFPLMSLVVRDPVLRTARARACIHHGFRAFVQLMRIMGIFSWEVHGLDRLHATGGLILANHPTLIDVVFLMSLIQRADCIVKSALTRNPFTRGPVSTAGFICNDSGPELVDACVASVRAGHNLIIFPEGTRSTAGTPLHLHRGAARVAVHGALDITPVRILCSPLMLVKGERWYQVPWRKAHFSIEVGEPIRVAQFLAPGVSLALSARRLNDHLAQYFSEGATHAPA